jgi:amidophosphoribosyltransferase
MSILCFQNRDLDDDLRAIFPENCGLAAAINLPNASYVAAQMITAIEKRGERGGGVVSRRRGVLYERRRVGPFSVQFREFSARKFRQELPGKNAIAHCRYATKGDPNLVANVQPLFVKDSRYGSFAIAHNGTLVNVEAIRKKLIKDGCKFDSTSDTEIFIHLILKSGRKRIEEAIVEAVKQVECAYSLLVITRDKVFAIRDFFGVRPLSIAKMNDGWLVCSETVAFDQFAEAQYVQDVAPGTMAVFEKGKSGFAVKDYIPAERRAAVDAVQKMRQEFLCIFEAIYFSNPRSKLKGVYHEDFRRAIGRQLVFENKDLAGDLVIPILDSGKHFAEGLAGALCNRLGVPFQKLYEEILQRAHGPLGGQKRSFTSVNTGERVSIVRKKLHLKKEAVEGRDVILVDDSIVRSNTAKVVVKMVREAGAKKVIFCVCFPPINNICPNGMDFQTRSQLIAYKKDIEAIRQEIGADQLIYLSVAGLYETVKKVYDCGICGGCFGGSYPVTPKNIRE